MSGLRPERKSQKPGPARTSRSFAAQRRRTGTRWRRPPAVAAPASSLSRIVVFRGDEKADDAGRDTECEADAAAILARCALPPYSPSRVPQASFNLLMLCRAVQRASTTAAIGVKLSQPPWRRASVTPSTIAAVAPPLGGCLTTELETGALCCDLASPMYQHGSVWLGAQVVRNMSNDGRGLSCALKPP